MSAFMLYPHCALISHLVNAIYSILLQAWDMRVPGLTMFHSNLMARRYKGRYLPDAVCSLSITLPTRASPPNT